jgi:hypothetical protein
MEPFDDAANGLSIQIRAAYRPWRARCQLLSMQQTRLHESFDRSVADPTESSRFASIN